LALQKIERATKNQFVTYVDYSLPLYLLIFNTAHIPTGSFEVNCLVCGTCHIDPTGGVMAQTPFLLEKKNPFYIGHIRAHSDLPSPSAAGNDCIEKALIGEALASAPIVLDKFGHDIIHFSSHNLMLLHKTPWEQVSMILKQCPDCLTMSQVPRLGANS
jgi:hypothetical protein